MFLLIVQDPLENLNEWSRNTNKLMDLVMRTTHLINKEEMVSNSLPPLPSTHSVQDPDSGVF